MKTRKLRYIYDSWKGVQKKQNQDGIQFIQTPMYSLFMIYDGVSSSPDSLAGVSQLKEFCSNNYSIYETEDKPDSGFNLAHMMEDMNIFLLKSKLDSPETTCCILYLPVDSRKSVQYSHLGDSRIYSVGKNIHCLTRDDVHPAIPNMLTKCLGLQRLSTEDFYQQKADKKITRFFLSTDGFFHVMESYQDDFYHYLKSPPEYFPKAKSEIEKLIKFRNADDATYILIDFSGGFA